MNASPEDSDLLRAYAQSGSEAAFAELVRRRIGLVYSVALRQTHGDAHRAEDATQAVFCDLARKAGALAQRPVLAGWLYRSAQYAAAGLVRVEQRRQAREQEAHEMDNILSNQDPRPDWDKLRPVLDQALNEMAEDDRDAILLRFFDERPFAEIGRHLRLTENAARMRVERALDQLHAALSRRGITSTTAALGVALGHQASATLPANLAASVTGAALAGATVGSGGLLAGFMTLGKMQAVIAGAIAAAGVTGYVTQSRANDRIQAEIAMQRVAVAEARGLRAENQRLAATLEEVAALHRDDAEFARLEQEVAAARRAHEARIRAARTREAAQMAQAEIDRLNREGNALVEEYKRLNARSRDGSLPPDERAQASEAMKAKMAAIQAKQREVRTYTDGARAGGLLPAADAGWYRENQEGSPAGAEWVAVDNDRVILRMPQANYQDLLTLYERVTAQRIIRDPSLARITGTININTAPSTKEDLRAGLRAGLSRMNIVLERAENGETLAKLGALEQTPNGGWSFRPDNGGPVESKK